MCSFRGQYFVYEENSDVPKVEDRKWQQQKFHYDDVAMAMLTLFAVQTGEGWPTYVDFNWLLPDLGHLNLIQFSARKTILTACFQMSKIMH